MTWPANSLDTKELETEGIIFDGVKAKAPAHAVQVLGDNLLSLIKAYSYRNIPLHLVKHIAKQVPIHLPVAASW